MATRPDISAKNHDPNRPQQHRPNQLIPEGSPGLGIEDQVPDINEPANRRQHTQRDPGKSSCLLANLISRIGNRAKLSAEGRSASGIIRSVLQPLQRLSRSAGQGDQPSTPLGRTRCRVSATKNTRQIATIGPLLHWHATRRTCLVPLASQPAAPKVGRLRTTTPTSRHPAPADSSTSIRANSQPPAARSTTAHFESGPLEPSHACATTTPNTLFAKQPAPSLESGGTQLGPSECLKTGVRKDGTDQRG